MNCQGHRRGQIADFGGCFGWIESPVYPLYVWDKTKIHYEWVPWYWFLRTAGPNDPVEISAKNPFFSRHMGLLYEIAMVEYSISNAYTSDDINWIHRNTLNLCHMTLLIRMYSVFLPMWNMKSEIVNSTSTMHASWWFLFWKLPYLAFLLWHSILYLNWGLAQFRRANLKCMSTLMFHHTPKTLNCVFTQTHTHIYRLIKFI